MPRWPPGPKLTPKVILEGTRLTHKTDLAFAINDWMTETGGLWAPGPDIPTA
jgi:hypothetical protein